MFRVSERWIVRKHTCHETTAVLILGMFRGLVVSRSLEFPR